MLRATAYSGVRWMNLSRTIRPPARVQVGAPPSCTAGQLVFPTEAEVEVLCQGGLYAEELISGDDGATQPDLACSGKGRRA